ncbi:MAG TPA: heparan-alpha-glucosaminide N-acetyltransferase domain-containing protein [Methylomirabilota bacterium]|nr:heparan-alpha-glucosaminide N-acetyltransferase domain-containing protein [Methylomirabilota bacterium]
MQTLTEFEPVKTRTPDAPVAAQRLMSVDALRGFDMFWIIGANALVSALNKMTQIAPVRFLGYQLEHADWEGFHFYDLIFPLFVFLVGVSIVFSLTKLIQQEGRPEALKRVARRTILLFIIALLYSGGFTNPWPDMRLLGVLNRIALAYGFAGLLFCFFKPRALAGICAGLLVGYWALMTFVPIRDIQLTRENVARLAAQAGDTETAAFFLDKNSGNPTTNKNSPVLEATRKLFYATTARVTGKYGQGYNLSDHTDFQYLPGKRWDTFADPEGYLSTLPAIATCLLGIFAGLLLRNTSVDDRKKVMYLVAFGIAGVVLGWLWNLQFPVIKKIWTSSYVLVAGGYSALLLAAFYLLVDVWKYQKWCQPFVWIGMNSITIYLTSNIIGGFSKLATRFAGGDVRSFFNLRVAGLGDLLVAIIGLSLAFWFVHFLYRKKIFLRL